MNTYVSSVIGFKNWLYYMFCLQKRQNMRSRDETLDLVFVLPIRMGKEYVVTCIQKTQESL